MNSSNLTVGGAVTVWQVAKNTKRDELLAMMGGLGLASFVPQPRTDLSCLRAVITDVYVPQSKEERYVIRPIKNGVKGFAVVSERPKDRKEAGEDWGKVVATAFLDKEGCVCLSPPDSIIESEVYERMDSVRQWLPAASVSKALIDLAEKACDGVTLRANGGVYWVRDDQLDRWQSVANAFESASRGEEGEEGEEDSSPTRVYILRVVADEQMVRAVGDFLTAEVNQSLSVITAEVEGGELSKESCEIRVERVCALAAKIKRYETAFGEPLTKLNEAVTATGQLTASAAIQEAAAASVPRLSVVGS